MFYQRCTRQILNKTRTSSLCRGLIQEPTKYSRVRIISRCFSWQGHGTDLLGDSLAHSASGVPKIILHGHGTTGIDVVNMIKNKDPSDEELQKTEGIVHMAGSIMAFPAACFLWSVRTPEDLTVESLAPILLYRPKLEYLFLGSKQAIPPATIKKIRESFADADMSIVVEPMDVSNAIGTFNILNGEDRMVGVAIILPEVEDDDED